ncbi:MAG: EamA family transporter [Mycobacteriales bacterium]|nr:EamA family transporter [Frankia sp.]
MTPRTPETARHRVMLGIALVSVYLIWGSTYLAIFKAVRPDHGAAIPPLLMGAMRFAIAGGLLFGLFVRRPAPDGRPDPLGWPQWRATAVVGLALLLGGNGAVMLAEQRIPSGVTAVLVAAVPLWAALIGALRRTDRLSRAGVVGLVVGFAGVVILVNPSAGHDRVDTVGALLVIGGALSWAIGSYYSRGAPMPRRPLVMTGMEMLWAAAAMGVVSLVTGDAGRFHPTEVGAGAWLALAYLIVFGAMVAFTAYVWLLRNAPLSLATTYAYVNPVVAVFLGALLNGEPLTARVGVATTVIVIGVALIVTRPRAAVPAGSEAASAVTPLAEAELIHGRPRASS